MLVDQLATNDQITIKLVIHPITCQAYRRLACLSSKRADDPPAIAPKTLGSTTAAHATTV